MTRFASLVVLALALLASGCDKPDEASCRKAIENMRVLMGTEKLSDNNKLEGEVRRCKGGSSKKAVKCAIESKSYDELRACGMTKLPAISPMAPREGSGVGSGSAVGAAAGSEGSAAATGSGAAAATGSGAAAATGSGSAAATGSGAAAATGSGSAAATGSAAAAGSAAGSAAATGSAN